MAGWGGSLQWVTELHLGLGGEFAARKGVFAATQEMCFGGGGGGGGAGEQQPISFSLQNILSRIFMLLLLLLIFFFLSSLVETFCCCCFGMKFEGKAVRHC